MASAVRTMATLRRNESWTPSVGDVILRWLGGGLFEVVDAQTSRRLGGPISLSDAIELARTSGATVIWQQNLDDRGRPLGSPYRIPLTQTS